MKAHFLYLQFDSESTAIDAAKQAFPYSEQVQDLTDTMLDIESGEFLATGAMLTAFGIEITPEIQDALGSYPISIRVIRDEQWSTGTTVQQEIEPGVFIDVDVTEAVPGFRVNIKIQGESQRLPIAVGILEGMLSQVLISTEVIRKQWPYIRKFSGDVRP